MTSPGRPTLDALADRVELTRQLPAPDAFDLYLRAQAVATACALRLATAAAPPAEPDRLLNADEAAQLVGLTARYLRREADRLPFARRPTPGRVRFSFKGIQDW